MTTTPNAPELPTAAETVQLAPSYALSIGLLLLSIGLWLLQPWLGGAIAALALFLLVQTATLRLRFTSTALELYRGDRLLRHFPYQDWQNWRIFGFSLPILLYFKEVNSIHFLPILFDPKMLRACLEQRCPVIR